MQGQDSIVVSIYALIDPRTEEVKYIGQTARTLAQRLAQHLADYRTCAPAKAAWIAELRACGLRPRIELLETTDEHAANDAERRHMREARRRGAVLVNGTLGGARLRPRRAARAYARKDRMTLMVSEGPFVLAQDCDLPVPWRHMVRMPQEWAERVERLADEQGVPVAVMLRLLVHAGLERWEAWMEARVSKGEQP